MALSLENLVDPHALYIQRPEAEEDEASPARLRVRPYLDPYVNPAPEPPKEAEEGASPEPLPQAHPGHPGLFGPARPPGPLAEGHPGDRAKKPLLAPRPPPRS
ncbi:MAG: hypothetical protein ABDH20_10760 [Thermus sp.]